MYVCIIPGGLYVLYKHGQNKIKQRLQDPTELMF